MWKSNFLASRFVIPKAKKILGMNIKINHQETEIATHSVLSDIVSTFTNGNLKGIAVAVNGKVIPGNAMSGYVIQSADSILIIKATQGG